MTKRHQPLTLNQLRTIQDRNRQHDDAMMLLREIKRLHTLLNNCWQVLDSTPSGPVNSPLDLLKGLIDREPCVKAQRAAYARAGTVTMEGK